MALQLNSRSPPKLRVVQRQQCRETDTLSTLSENLQSLRATTTQQIQTISRLETKATELDRQLAIAVAHERTAKATLRSSETKNRTLREEMGKLKLTVSQIRGQCANDIRKRDGEISKLKRYLEGRRGRDGTGGQVGVVLVMPGVSRNGKGSTIVHSEAEFESPDYSLKQDTTNYLTELCQNLSNENDALATLVRNSLATLRDLQGLSPGVGDHSETTNPHEGIIEDPNVTLTIAPSYETLAADMVQVLEHLRGLLTTPFASIEEVEIRDEEIVRLREGWDKMEARWREAVTLMASGHKRTTKTGDTINLEDLRKGLTLEADVPVESIEGVNSASNLETSNADDRCDSKTIILPMERSTTSPSPPITDLPIPILRENPLGAGLFPAPSALTLTTGDARRLPLSSPRKASFQSAAHNPDNTPESESETEPTTEPDPSDEATPSPLKFADLCLFGEEKQGKARAGTEAGAVRDRGGVVEAGESESE
ncbi:MAG: hypothetical protein Q9187_006099, partial [Circinaria calcarea]